MVLDVKLRTAADEIKAAKTAQDVLGPDDDGRKSRLKALSRFLHPDGWGSHPKARLVATEAFAQLQALLATEAKVGSSNFEITTRKRTYLATGLAFSGKVSNLYNCSYERDGQVKFGLLKLPRSVRDNDLVAAEASVLRKIWDSKSRRREFFPRFEEAFKHRDKTTGIERRALVIRRLPDFISLADVKLAIPEGLDGRDLAWIWRRALAALSLPAEMGLVHGALVPEHILIHPSQHGVILAGWSSTVPSGERLRVLGGARRFYPPEVFAKEPASVATDIYTLHATMGEMLRADAPKQFRAFLKGCMFDRPAVRPQDPRALLGELDALLEQLYGARKFRPFHVPERTTP